jgi:CRP-like cAMP-binding protein
VQQLLELVAIAREVPLASGQVLLSERDRPAFYHVLHGDVHIHRDGNAPVVVGPGATIGIAETLAGLPSSIRAVVAADGQALRLDRDELFDVLVNHVDLLQGVFSGVLNVPQRPAD